MSTLARFGADLLDNPEAYGILTITYAGNVTTPTLLLHDEQEQPVPVNQVYAFLSKDA